jgi:hypothetical protein
VSPGSLKRWSFIRGDNAGKDEWSSTNQDEKEEAMLSKTLSRSAVSVLGIVFAVTVFIGFSGNIAIAEVPDDLFTDPVLKAKYSSNG